MLPSGALFSRKGLEETRTTLLWISLWQAWHHCQKDPRPTESAKHHGHWGPLKSLGTPRYSLLRPWGRIRILTKAHWFFGLRVRGLQQQISFTQNLLLLLPTRPSMSIEFSYWGYSTKAGLTQDLILTILHKPAANSHYELGKISNVWNFGWVARICNEPWFNNSWSQHE